MERVVDGLSGLCDGAGRADKEGIVSLHNSLFGEEVDRGNSQGLGDGIEGCQGDVSLASFHGADVGPVEPAFFGANLLGPFPFEAEAAQVLGYYSCGGLICHKGNCIHK